MRIFTPVSIVKICGKYCRAIATLLAFTTPLTAVAASTKVIFYYDENAQPVVRLNRISPMPEGLKAILAMYSLQNGTGCSGGADNLNCVLTNALGIDSQCSDEHIKLVSKWFQGRIPKMGGYADSIYQNTTPDTLKSICYNAPDTATFQEVWDSIRITKSKNHYTIHGHGGWLAREESGDFEYITEYEVVGNHVSTISHKKIFAAK